MHMLFLQLVHVQIKNMLLKYRVIDDTDRFSLLCLYYKLTIYLIYVVASLLIWEHIFVYVKDMSY